MCVYLGNSSNFRIEFIIVFDTASQHNKEWKPKSSQKLSTSNPGVIGTPSKSKSPTDESRELPSEAANVQDKLARVDLHENQNVIIAEHIRVPDNDQYGLVFGSFGAEFDSSTGLLSGLQAVRGPEELSVESSSRFVYILYSSIFKARLTKIVSLGNSSRLKGFPSVVLISFKLIWGMEF